LIPERKSAFFLWFLLGSFLVLALIGVHAAFQTRANLSRLQQGAEFIKNLHLTDLCLMTEARYTRHPSQADWHSPFQSHPLALEHFPSGTVIRPPETIRHGQ
jgi:hypothetical protein